MKEDLDIAYDFAAPAIADYEVYTDYETERDKPMPNRVHGIIESNLAFYLKSNYRDRFSVGTEITLDLPDRPATPDVLLMEKEPLDLFDDAPRVSKPPVTTIEIISPSQGFSVFKNKADRYFAFGVKSYWVVQPHLRTIYVFSGPRAYRTFINDDILQDTATGVEMPMAEIFS